MADVQHIPTDGSWLERYRATLRIALWCGGLLYRPQPHTLAIKVEGQTAHPGDWIRQDGNGFEVVASRAEADL
ncbi:hypothetical protein BOX05_gp50 [Gordonia phage GAL1]|uniref:Uncharacterized protein n=2 Tax=root TaxID=1 RepID=A0A159B6E5_9CAUD|nr:hypothetical protein BOX05_gp50 [Gordonia phage GAL1]AKJ72065.1 hypothetical protein GAL1_50 [Gordonia phage GAL1]